MECIISIFLLIAVMLLALSIGMDLVLKIKRIIEERKVKKALEKIDKELDKMLTKITNEIIADSMKKKTEETKNKTTTRRKQSDKKED